MYFGVDYYPEQWVFPYGGTADKPEAAMGTRRGIDGQAGVNVVRMGEFTWGLCEPEEGKYRFCLAQAGHGHSGPEAGIKVVLATPTAAPPIWLSKKYPEILPLDEKGIVKHEGTRRAVCLNSDVYWELLQAHRGEMAKALGQPSPIDRLAD